MNSATVGNLKPTEKQLRYLGRLVKAAGRTTNLADLSKNEASALIDELSNNGQNTKGVLNNGTHESGSYDERDRKAAFGMATKLVYQRYLTIGAVPPNGEGFWKKVREFFEEYEKERERVFSLSRFSEVRK